MKRITLLVCAGIAITGALPASGCTGGAPDDGEQSVAEQGTLSMALQTVSESGKVYRLRNAVLPVDRFAGLPEPTLVLNSEDDPSRPVIETLLQPASYRIELLEGWVIEQVDNLLGTSAPVEAVLLNSPVQLFGIESNGETFVKYGFEVDGERIVFGPPGRLIVGIGVNEREGTCGNGRIDPGELCDGFDLGGESCVSVTMNVFNTGVLRCTPSCTFDTSGCFGGQVPDGGGGTFGVDGGGGTFGIGGGGGTFGIDGGPFDSGAGGTTFDAGSGGGTFDSGAGDATFEADGEPSGI